jgi:phosphoesterase RecJ-like protein
MPTQKLTRLILNAIDIPRELLDFIGAGEKFLIAGHKEPDGDCVGSQLALASALKRLGKKSVLCSAGPFKRTEIKSYERLFTAAPSAEDRAGARVIIMDCGAPDRTGDLAPCLEGLPSVVIDHHAVGTYAEGGENHDTALVYIESGAPSTTFIVFHLIKALGLEPSKEEAELLLFGLCTDTGFFRHVDEKGRAVFEIAAELTGAGASPKKTFQEMHGGKSLDSRILMGLILARTEACFGGKLLFSTEEYEETRRFGLEGRDSDSVYQMLQTVTGMEAIVIIRQEKPDNCTVGFRSREDIDVAAVARMFGGGGHKNAAGASIPGTIAELKPKILKAFENLFM